MVKYKACVIESKKTKKRFIEYTDKKLIVRLNELNKGRGTSNKWFLENRPFKIVYYEIYYTKKEVIERISFLKSEREISPDTFDRRIEDRRKKKAPRLPDRCVAQHCLGERRKDK
jgi:hypothetical protein